MAACLQAWESSKCLQSCGADYVFHVLEKEEGGYRKEKEAQELPPEVHVPSPTLYPSHHTPLLWHLSTLQFHFPSYMKLPRELKLLQKHTEPKGRHFCIWDSLLHPGNKWIQNLRPIPASSSIRYHRRSSTLLWDFLQPNRLHIRQHY